jgi:hypothetical protein
MKTKQSCIIFLLFISTFSFAQINPHGFSGLKWKTAKSSFTDLKNCDQLQAGSNFENCEYLSTDSLFLKKYKYSYANFRFYKGKFCEANFDLNHKDLGNLIAELTSTLGQPVIKENKTRSESPSGNVIGYEWVTGDTKILILNKGFYYPAWCTLSSVSMKKSIKSQQETDIENLIFE